MYAQTELKVHVWYYTCLPPVLRRQFFDDVDNFIFHSRSPMPRSTHILTSVVSLLISAPPVAPSAASPPASCPSSPSPFSPPSFPSHPCTQLGGLSVDLSPTCRSLCCLTSCLLSLLTLTLLSSLLPQSPMHSPRWSPC